MAPELFLTKSRAPHRPLTTWAAQLDMRLRALSLLSRRSLDYLRRLINTANEAALVEASRGDLSSAAMTCRRQLRFVAGWVHEFGLDAARYAVNPWLNLGRLASLAGAPAEALAHFRRFNPPAGESIADLGCVRLDLDKLDALMLREYGHVDFCNSLYVTDSLKVCVRSGAWDDIEFFLTSATDPFGKDVAAEARILESIHRHAFAEGERLARMLAESTKTLVRIVALARAFEAACGCGDRANADLAFDDLEKALSRILPGVPSAAEIAVAIHAVRIAAGAGSAERGIQVAEAALDAARRSGDEVLTFRAASVVAELSTAGRRGEARDELQRIWHSTLYHEICGEQRRPPDVVAAMAARVDGLLRESDGDGCGA